jgi:DNA-directed RNA polymerase subunit beta'
VLGRTVAEDVLDPATGEVIVPAGTLVDERDVVAIEAAKVDAVQVRSVLTCETIGGVCAKCYGRDLARGTPVNVGEAVGVIAAQSIGEPGTQLTMRTFHIGGAAQAQTEESTIDAVVDGTFELVRPSLVKDSEGRLIVMGRNSELVIYDAMGREKARHKLQTGTRLTLEPGSEIQKGQRLAEWDPHTLPIVTEMAGRIAYQDMIEGTTYKEVVDEATGKASKEVITPQTARSGTLRPSLLLQDANGQPLKFANGNEARYYLPVAAILTVEHGAEVQAGDILARIPKEASKTRDITGGLPRVAELFEARKPKDPAVIAEIHGRIEFQKDYKAKRRLRIVPEESETVAGTAASAAPEPVEYLIPKGRHIVVQDGDIVAPGDPIVDGNPVPHDILRVLGVPALAEYLCAEIQEVYRLQGVKINDKHIEVVVRQMLQKVEVTEPGETTFLVGEQVDRLEFIRTNEIMKRQDKRPAGAIPVLQGITKASLQTPSFISAASFQETTRVLTEAAFAGKSDDLLGLKENVIVGRLIPAGTGGVLPRLQGRLGEDERFAPPQLDQEPEPLRLPDMGDD